MRVTALFTFPGVDVAPGLLATSPVSVGQSQAAECVRWVCTAGGHPPQWVAVFQAGAFSGLELRAGRVPRLPSHLGSEEKEQLSYRRGCQPHKPVF